MSQTILKDSYASTDVYTRDITHPIALIVKLEQTENPLGISLQN